jgi:cytochrome c oxidase subunit 4
MSEHNETNAEAEYHEQHHVVSPVLYGVILFVLLCATALTCGMSYIDLGDWHVFGVTLFWNPVVALAIACTKMTLVVLFFMHIKYSRRLTKLTVLSGLFLFLTLIGMTLTDYMSRAWGRW